MPRHKHALTIGDRVVVVETRHPLQWCAGYVHSIHDDFVTIMFPNTEDTYKVRRKNLVHIPVPKQI